MQRLFFSLFCLEILLGTQDNSGMKFPQLINNLDMRYMMHVQNHVRNPFLNVVFKASSFLCNGSWFYLLVPLIFVIQGKYRRQGMFAIIAAGVTALIVAILLKRYFSRTRPFVETELIQPIIKKPKDSSFPSGHSATSFGCAFMFLFTMPLYFSIPMLFFASMTGYSRTYVGVHYLSDVLGGIFTGFLISFSIYFFLF